MHHHPCARTFAKYEIQKWPNANLRRKHIGIFSVPELAVETVGGWYLFVLWRGAVAVRKMKCREEKCWLKYVHRDEGRCAQKVYPKKRDQATYASLRAFGTALCFCSQISDLFVSGVVNANIS